MAEINSMENMNLDVPPVYNERDLVDDNAVEFGMDLLTEPAETGAIPSAGATPANPVPSADSTPAAAEQRLTHEEEATRYVDRQTQRAAQEEARSARQQAATQMGAMVTALKTQRIVNGKIAGVVTHDRATYWNCFFGDITVEIPFSESWTSLPKELVGKRDDGTLLRQKQFLSRSIGAEIPFILTSMGTSPKGDIVYSASRVAAMKIIRKAHFGRRPSRPAKIGSEFYGRIMSMGPYTAYVSFCGVDVPVPNYELSHEYIADVSTQYDVNQELKLQIVDMTLDNEGNPEELILSAKPIELERYKKNLKRIVINRNAPPRYHGTVTSIRRDRRRGHVVVNLFLDDVEVPAFSRSLRLSLQDELHTGDKVYFEASGIVEPGYVHGTIVRYNRAR